MKHVRIRISRASYRMVLLICIATLLDLAIGQTQCKRVSSGYSLSVASLCYKTSVSAGRVVLDGFLTYNSSTFSCSCSLTSTQNTAVTFTPLNSIQPNYLGCDSNIRVQNGETILTMNCFVSGTISVSPSDTVTLTFERPLYGYNSDYCVLLTPDNSNAVLTLSCDGDLNVPSTTKTPEQTTLSTTMEWTKHNARKYLLDFLYRTFNKSFM
uniref:Uncharacterized protein LOC111100751 n=1 Tax=Crassostrea virginica TaxID=6565 RepID=A0A8B8AAP8_CRAVI|nr:uncharacterized protein LOC111100751 [Crassostrea virginica]